MQKLILALVTLSAASAWARSEYISEKAAKGMVRAAENQKMKIYYHRELPKEVRVGLLKGQDSGPFRTFVLYDEKSASTGQIEPTTVQVDMRRNRPNPGKSRLSTSQQWYSPIPAKLIRK